MIDGDIIITATEWDGRIAGTIDVGPLTSGVITMVGIMDSTIDIEVLT